MRKILRRYKAMPYEEKTILKTKLGCVGSALLASAKFIAGLFSDYNLISVSLYTIGILFAKLECVFGAKNQKRTFSQRKRRIAFFLFASSILYIGVMVRMLFLGRAVKNFGLGYVVFIAFVSFAELGFALDGLRRTSKIGHFYRDIKIINFGLALIAILTTQMTILDYLAEGGADLFNSVAGIGVGIFIALSAVYVVLSPKISVVGRERNVFRLFDAEKNRLIPMQGETTELLLKKSTVYGSYVYRGTIREDTVDGNIERGASLWKGMPVALKILCCILSEILIFVWLFGRLVFFFRTVNLPGRLEKTMIQNGFVKI